MPVILFLVWYFSPRGLGFSMLLLLPVVVEFPPLLVCRAYQCMGPGPGFKISKLEVFQLEVCQLEIFHLEIFQLEISQLECTLSAVHMYWCSHWLFSN
jgi:hypothetical protein